MVKTVKEKIHAPNPGVIWQMEEYRSLRCPIVYKDPQPKFRKEKEKPIREVLRWNKFLWDV